MCDECNNKRLTMRYIQYQSNFKFTNKTILQNVKHFRRNQRLHHS
jgi:hypothetical protein